MPAPPPLLARWIIGSLIPAPTRESMLGDLVEEYYARLDERASPSSASRWFWSQVWRSVPFALKSALESGWIGNAIVATSVFATMAILKYGTDVLLAKWMLRHRFLELWLPAVVFTLLAASGGWVAATIRERSVVALALMLMSSVVVLSAINACPIPVPWWYRPAFFVAAPFAVLVPAALINEWSHQ